MLDGVGDRIPGSRRTWVLTRALVHEVRSENLTFMAGSIAYHAFVSLLPLLVLLLLAFSSLGGESLAERIFDLVEAAFTPEGRRIVTAALEGGRRVSGVSLLGLGLLLWATLRIFRGLDQAFSAIYETESRNTILDQIGDGFVVLGVVVLAVLGASVVHTRLVFPGGGLGTLLEALFAIVALAGALLPMYYLFPDESLGVVEAIPGTVFAAIGVVALETGFRLYVAVSTTGENYGVLGGVLVLLTWLYFNSLVVLLGAALNAVLSNRSDDVDVRPAIGDHRPGIGRTFGESLAAGEETDAIKTRLETLARRAENAEWITVRVDGEEVRLPPPRRTRLTDDSGDATGIDLRW